MVAGNAGQMANNKRVAAKRQEKEKSSQSAAGAKGDTGGEREKETPVVEFPFEQLCCDVQHELGEYSKEIAEVMRRKALSGNTTFAKMLLEIAKTKETGKGAARLRRGPSAAQSLAKERQWTGPLPGEEIDYYDGSPNADDEEKAATG